MTSVFPFTIKATYSGHYVSSAGEFREVFLKFLPEGETYYAYDVTIRSLLEVTFDVFGMACNVTGGIGQKKFSFDASVPMTSTRETIVARAVTLAKQYRREELAAAEAKLIEAKACQILRDCGL